MNIFGTLLFIICSIGIIALSIEIAGWWGVIIGLLICLFAARPAKYSDRWIWQK